MDHLSDDEIIRGILDHKTSVIDSVYSDCFPMVERMVINSGGDQEQAKDVFQDCWMIVYRKLYSGELRLTCKFSTFFYAICKKLWFQERRKRISRMRHLLSEPEIVEESEPDIYEDDDRVKKLFFKHFNQLSSDCQKLLLLHFNKASIEDIQRIMKYQNSHYTMDRKYRCKKSLIQRILHDPNFKAVQNEYSRQIRSIY